MMERGSEKTFKNSNIIQVGGWINHSYLMEINNCSAGWNHEGLDCKVQHGHCENSAIELRNSSFICLYCLFLQCCFLEELKVPSSSC